MAKAERISVLIVDDIPDTHENLKKLLYFEKDIDVVASAMDGTQAIEMAKKLAPDVILMDINMPGMDGIATTEAIVSSGSASQIIMMSIQGETDYLRRSMLAGAREFLIKPFSCEELASSIRRVHALPVQRPVQQVETVPVVNHTIEDRDDEEKGKLIVVFSPKGGVGRTTIIANLAVALKEVTEKKVVLVDVNLQFGDLAVFFNIQPQKTVMDVLPHMTNLDDDIVEDILMTHSSGVKLLLSPPKPEMAELVPVEAVNTVITRLRNHYEYVLVDTPPVFTDHVLAVLDAADRILTPVTLEVASIKSIRLFLDVANALGYQRGKITLVMNRADSSVGIKLSDVESNLGLPIPVSILSDWRVVTQALNQGVPLVACNRNSPVAKGIYSLAKHLAGLDGVGLETEKSGNGFQKNGLSRLAGGLPFKKG